MVQAEDNICLALLSRTSSIQNFKVCISIASKSIGHMECYYDSWTTLACCPASQDPTLNILSPHRILTVLLAFSTLSFSCCLFDFLEWLISLLIESLFVTPSSWRAFLLLSQVKPLLGSCIATFVYLCNCDFSASCNCWLNMPVSSWGPELLSSYILRSIIWIIALLLLWKKLYKPKIYCFL